MASHSPHRKLFPADSNYSTTVQTCLYFCNTQKNETTGFCPTPCLAICPSICHFSLSALIISPTNDPNKSLPSSSSSSSSSSSHLSPLLISMLIILASAFLLFTFYAIYTKLYFRYYHHQTRLNNRRNPRSDPMEVEHAPTVIFHPAWYIPTAGLNPSVISTIQVRKYMRGEEKPGVAECTDCAVCLAEFEDGEELRVLPKCNHAFHIPCIDTWLKSHTNCPLCRAPVIATDLDWTVENSAPPSMAVSATAEGDFPREVRINVGETEENMELGEINNQNNTTHKVCPTFAGSSSQRWGLERGAANLLSRSFSCGAKIFSSRYINNNNANL